jgi:hypothetical protein
MSLTLQKSQKCLARMPRLSKTPAVRLLSVASKPLNYVFVFLPQAILAIVSTVTVDFTAIYTLISLARFLFRSIHTRIDNQAMAITATLLLTLPLAAIQLSLTVLHSLSKPTASTWQRRVSSLGWAVVSGTYWCATAMLLVDLGVSRG